MNLLRPHTTRLAPLFVLALLSGACKSTTADKGAATGENITRAADAIQLGIGQLDASMTALNGLVNEPAADLAPQFKTFSKNLDMLDSTAKKVRAAATEMEGKGKAYFTEWDAQIAAIQNEDIRARSEDRRKVVEASFSKIRTDYDKSREGFQPLMNDLLDIRTALGSDLTMSGLDAVKKSVKKANSESEAVKKSLQGLVDSFRKLGVSMSKSGPPQPEKTEKK